MGLPGPSNRYLIGADGLVGLEGLLVLGDSVKAWMILLHCK